MGAIASGGVRVVNADIAERLGISDERIEAVAARERIELERRELREIERRQADLAAELEGRLSAIRRLEQLMLGRTVEQPAADGGTRWNIDDLQRRVDADGPLYPERLPEWSSYLLYLRAYANAQGILPPTLDPLVREIFEPIL
jgi:hypothetical protein